MTVDAQLAKRMGASPFVFVKTKKKRERLEDLIIKDKKTALLQDSAIDATCLKSMEIQPPATAFAFIKIFEKRVVDGDTQELALNRVLKIQNLNPWTLGRFTRDQREKATVMLSDGVAKELSQKHLYFQFLFEMGYFEVVVIGSSLYE